MSYKKNADSNRNALFGGGPSSKKPSGPAKSSSSSGYKYGGGTTTTSQKKGPTVRRVPVLQGEARDRKLKEAEDYKAKAKKCMQKGLFKSPDPIAASTYYKRAADAYQACGDEHRMERFYRIESGQCNLSQNVYAGAAADFTRAAELCQLDEQMDLLEKRAEGKRLHTLAADAWTQMNEKSKAAASKVKAAMAVVWEEDEIAARHLSKEALQAMEEAVEAHVPDPLNRYCRYRQTGTSAFVAPDESAETASDETKELCKEHMVSKAFAHESLQPLMEVLVQYGEYASALYVAGANTAILQADGIATLTLSRAFVVETILTLAMGDPVAAEEQFLQTHCQSTSYLKSRECKLSEELFRAVKFRDADALEEARSPKGSNRAALANLNESMRNLVQLIRLSGVARRGQPEDLKTESKPVPKKETKKPKAAASKSKEAPAMTQELLDLDFSPSGKAPPPPAANKEPAKEEDAAVLQDELDGLDFGDDSEELDDDELDLR